MELNLIIRLLLQQGFGREYEKYVDLNKVGGISTKGMTIYPKMGNEGRRIYETPSGLMNSIGLQIHLFKHI